MYYEEYEVGKVYDLEPIKFTKEEIISFAEEWDPRWFHIDEEEAKKSVFGGIIASGFHTLVNCWSVWVKTGIDHENLICGIGINSAKWLKPVYPGDELTGRLTISDKQKKEGSNKGSVEMTLEVKNQNGEDAFSMSATSLIYAKNKDSK